MLQKVREFVEKEEASLKIHQSNMNTYSIEENK